MKSKKRIYVVAAAVLIGVPAVLIVGLIVALTMDRRRVESEAEQCEALMPALHDFKGRAGRFPTADEASRIDPKLRTLCRYAGSADGFSMSVYGELTKFEAYNFDSQAGVWFWD